MPKIESGSLAQLVTRLGLGFVLTWFGIQELRDPASWAIFVPGFISDHSPVAVEDLLLLHGFLLVLAAALIVAGIFYLPGCLLAVGLLVEIVFGLWLDNGMSDLVVRDIGLLAVGAALAVAPLRSWSLESAVVAWVDRHTQRRPAKAPRNALLDRAWLVRLATGAGVMLAVILLAFAVNGSSSSDLQGASVVSLQPDAASPSPQAPASSSNAGAGATPQPTAAGSVRFDDWQYKRYAFQVYPGPVNDDAKKALAGFDLKVQDAGDNVTLLLKALSSRYRDSQVTVSKQDTAYFIETTMRDDPNDQENNLRDDGIIEVNPQGYILQS